MTKRIKTRGDNALASDCPTIIEFLLDETASMSSWKAATISGFNTFLSEQREQPGRCLLTLTKFDTSGLKTPYIDMDVSFVPVLTNETFVPGRSTNLRDAIGERAKALQERLSSWSAKPNVLFVVLTDGEDNSSRYYSEHQVNDLIKAREAEGWSFVYLGATRNALDVANRLGFNPNNAKQFEATNMYDTMTELSRSTTAYRSAYASGAAAGSDREFFSR